MISPGCTSTEATELPARCSTHSRRTRCPNSACQRYWTTQPPLDDRPIVGAERLRQKRPEFVLPALPDEVAKRRHEQKRDRSPQTGDRPPGRLRHPGSTAPEIPGHAATDEERAIKLASIRTELHNGRARGRYESDNGRWSLAVSEAPPSAPEEAASSDPSLGAPQNDQEAPNGLPVQGDDPSGSEPDEGKSRGTLRLDL